MHLTLVPAAVSTVLGGIDHVVSVGVVVADAQAVHVAGLIRDDQVAS